MTNFSESEQHGIEQVNQTSHMILSIGISTDGNAEIAMARKNPKSKIIATTIDKQGIEQTRKKIIELGLENQIELKIEDVSNPMPYQNDTFDYVYARLVLHYLNNQQFENTLQEIRRVLKPQGKFYMAVKSDKELSYKKILNVDNSTGLTSYLDPWNTKVVNKRKFMTKQAVKKSLKKFNILSLKEFNEQTSSDYERKQMVPHPSPLIEAIAQKE